MPELATAQDLPYEMLREISSHVFDCSTLEAGSFVSSNWRDPFQQQLFQAHAVVIEIDANEGHTLISTLAHPEHTRLLNAITSIRIQGEHSNRFRSDIFGEQDKQGAHSKKWGESGFFSDLLNLLLALPNLSCLTLRNARFDWNRLSRNERGILLRVFSRLRELSFHSLTLDLTFPLTLLRYAGKLDVLKILDIQTVTNNKNHLFGLLLKTLPPPSVLAVPLRSLSLQDTGLIARFLAFADRHEEWNFLSHLEDLSIHYTDYGLTPHANGISCTGIAGLFLKRFGGTVETLRIHVTRPQMDVVSFMNLDDLQNLGMVKNLQVVLHIDWHVHANICPFPEMWLLPILMALPSRGQVTRLSLTYQLFIPPPICPFFTHYSNSLRPFWYQLDLILKKTWTQLKEFRGYVDLYQRDTVEETRWERRLGGKSDLPISGLLWSMRGKVDATAVFSDPITRNILRSSS